jgi:hypothetical protein
LSLQSISNPSDICNIFKHFTACANSFRVPKHFQAISNLSNFRLPGILLNNQVNPVQFNEIGESENVWKWLKSKDRKSLCKCCDIHRHFVTSMVFQTCSKSFQLVKIIRMLRPLSETSCSRSIFKRFHRVWNIFRKFRIVQIRSGIPTYFALCAYIIKRFSAFEFGSVRLLLVILGWLWYDYGMIMG